MTDVGYLSAQTLRKLKRIEVYTENKEIKN